MNKLDFKAAFMFPFNKFVRIFNVLWILIPIIGMFAFLGYKIRIIQGFNR